MSVIIHPQALLQIADHATRSKYQTKDIEFICGVIYGSCTGMKGMKKTKIEICSTTEALLNRVDDGLEVDKEAYKYINEHHAKNFVDEIPIGWYYTQELDEETLEKMNKAFGLVFDVVVKAKYNDGDHPLNVYVPGSEPNTWKEAIYSYESELAERVALLQLQADGSADNQISFTQDAYNALDKQLSRIVDYLEKVKQGEMEFKPDLVRKCATVARWWKHNYMKESQSIIPPAQISYIIGMIGETLVEFEKMKEKK